MTKIDIFSGFLGSGKTTLIKKLVADGYNKEKVVLIENEFGEIGIDGGFLKEAGIQISEINSGCICCSLTGDFKAALKKVYEEYHPDRIIIEPSGVGKLSEVAAAVMSAGEGNFEMNGFTTVVDCKKAKMYIKNFGEFFNDQVATANVIILSRTQMVTAKQVEDVVNLLRMLNDKAVIITAPWDELSGAQILEAIDGKFSVNAQLQALLDEEAHEHEHHHHHDDDDDDDEECGCGHHHHHEDDDDDDDDECECGHHHHHEEHEHHHDEEHEHHHHEDGEECSCGCGHHHHGHDADEVFTSWGVETAREYDEDVINLILEKLQDDSYGFIVRAKGIVKCTEGGWIHFDYTPGEIEIRKGPAAPTGLLCVIGANLKTDKVARLFEN